jgi:hypothetical protein
MKDGGLLSCIRSTIFTTHTMLKTIFYNIVAALMTTHTCAHIFLKLLQNLTCYIFSVVGDKLVDIKAYVVTLSI